MISNKYNLPAFKLGIAKYLASKELSKIHNLPNGLISPRVKTPFEDHLPLPDIPEEGEVKLTGEIRQRRPSSFVTKPNFTFGDPDAEVVSFRTNSTVEDTKALSVSSVTTENMCTPLGPKKQNQCPRKASSSTVSTQECNIKKRNRLGSIEDEIKNVHIFMSPQAPRTGTGKKNQGQQMQDYRQELEDKYSKLLH